MTSRDADLFGVELHLVLSVWEELDIICPIDLLGDYSNLIGNRELERKDLHIYTLTSLQSFS